MNQQKENSSTNDALNKSIKRSRGDAALDSTEKGNKKTKKIKKTAEEIEEKKINLRNQAKELKSSFENACMSGDLEKLNTLLNNNPETDFFNLTTSKVLNSIVRSGNALFFERLMNLFYFKKKISKFLSVDGFFPVVSSMLNLVEKGEIQFVKNALTWYDGLDWSASSHLILRAYETNQIDFVFYLIDKSLDFDLLRHHSFLVSIVENADFETLERVLGYSSVAISNARKIQTFEMAFEIALNNSNLEMLKKLLEHSTSNAYVCNKERLVNAFDVKKDARSFAVIELLLLDGRFDPCVDDNLPLRMAIQRNQLYLIKLLLKDERVLPGLDL